MDQNSQNPQDPTQAAAGVPPVPTPVEATLPPQPVVGSAMPSPSVVMPPEPTVPMPIPPVEPTVPTVPGEQPAGVAGSSNEGGPQGGTPPVTPTY